MSKRTDGWGEPIPDDACERCNGDGYIMQLLSERAEDPIVGNNGDYEGVECPVCKGKKPPVVSPT